MINVPGTLTPIIKHLVTGGTRPVIVGGYVRDAILGITSKDIDIEVYGIESLQVLKSMLEPFGSVNEVGKSFGVLKLTYKGLDLDFALPRIESKTAPGHRGFSVVSNGNLSFKTAARRRDFTINAIGFDLETSTLLDPFNGQDDLHQKRLRCVEPDTFTEDPLRIMRAVQFAARYELVIESELLKLCRTMVERGELQELPKERIFEEIKKLLLKAERPSIGFELMKEMGILRHFPELLALQGVRQNPIYHPEGDVWIHTLMSLDAMAAMRSGDEKHDLLLMFAVLCHDLGKPSTTVITGKKISSLGHEEAGLEPTRSLLGRLTDEQRFIEQILPLVKYHMKPLQFYIQGAKSTAIKRLSCKVNINDLIAVSKADFLGRTTKEARLGIFPAGEWLKEKAKSLNVLHKAPKPLLQGKDLIKQGLTPSKQFKTILQTAYDAQLKGEYDTVDGARKWLRGYIERSDLGKS
jgi:tRNA nucleotidyltransferase (CCA-adding enzyme)